MNKQKVRVGISRRASGSLDDGASAEWFYRRSKRRAKLKTINGQVPYDPGKGPYECAYS